jgi:hypothetical protein
LRRSRRGTRETKCSVWDKKNAEWVRYDEARKRGITGDIGLRKSRYLAVTTNEDGEELGEADDDDEDEASDEDDEVNGLGDDSAALNGLKRGKKRKQPPTQILQDRTFEVKKWTQVAMDKADKMPEPKYLADRRPGMHNLYNQTAAGAWAMAQGYGAVLDGSAGPNYDLGDGSGLGSALGGGPGPNAGGADTPHVRKNMPPRPRKKKGGPGRKKKVVIEAERRAAEEARRKAEALARGEVEEVKPEGDDSALKPDITKLDEDGSATPRSRNDEDDDSEAEGSEEGEVNDESGDRSGHATPTPTPSGTPAGAGSTAAGNSMSTAPLIPSSLKQEVDGSEDAGSSMLDSGIASGTSALDTHMTEAPVEASVPPPAAEPTVATTLTELPPISSQTAKASVDVDQAPIASPLSVAADDIGLCEEDPTGTLTSQTAGEIKVPFDPSAESEVAPLLQGVEVGTGAQLDAEVVGAVPSPSASAGDAAVGADVKEAAAQGEVGELVRDQLPSNTAEEKVQEPSTSSDALATDSLDLLGGLEQAVASQQERREG